MNRSRRIHINPPADLSAALDRRAESRGIARPDLLRQAAREFLKRESQAGEDPIMGNFGLSDSSMEQPAQASRSGEGRTWSREDIYEERLGRFRP